MILHIGQGKGTLHIPQARNDHANSSVVGTLVV